MDVSSDSQETAEGGKKGEGATGYRYWTGKLGDGVQAPAPKAVPKKLSQEELAKVTHHSDGSAGSAWNKAGTWEERNLNSWGKDRVKELLEELEEVSFSGGRARVMEVTSCSGDATQFFVRGKRRCGYHFEIDLKWKGTMQEKEVSGLLKVPEAAFGELDEIKLETTFDGKGDLNSDSKNLIRKAFGGLVPSIVRRLSVFEEELKER